VNILINTLCFFGALALMEGVAYVAHKYVMHGFGWFLHESHHRPRQSWFELNDLYAFIFAIPSIVLIWYGTNGYPWALWTGLGVAGYGLIYFGFHDVIVHRRIHHQWRPKSKYMQRIVHAHRLHHASEEKEGTVSFGFVYAPPVPVLRAQMRAIEAERAAAEGVTNAAGG
jgi:beta-carotene 3-hydroxylase